MQQISREQLIEILSRIENGVEDLLSTRIKVYKKLNLDFSILSMNKLLDMLERFPELLKRPIIMNEKYVQIGFNGDDIRTFLSREVRVVELIITHLQ